MTNRTNPIRSSIPLLSPMSLRSGGPASMNLRASLPAIAYAKACFCTFHPRARNFFYFLGHNSICFLSGPFLKTASEGSKNSRFVWGKTPRARRDLKYLLSDNYHALIPKMHYLTLGQNPLFHWSKYFADGAKPRINFELFKYLDRFKIFR
jgi:hypothetical protein